MPEKSKEREQREEKLLKLLEDWRELEDSTIASCSEIMDKTKNHMLGTLIASIQKDSEKHRSILQLIIDSMTKEWFAVTSEEIAQISALVNRHIGIEDKSIDTAREAMTQAPDTVIKLLMQFILRDEENHKNIANFINGLKAKASADGGSNPFYERESEEKTVSF